jgi:glycosidase
MRLTFYRSRRRKEADSSATSFRLLTSSATFASALFVFGFQAFAQPVLTVNGLNANYTTTHVFVDEVAGDAIPLTILFTPNTANLTQVEFYSNVNRRDRATADADGDGVEDGIRQPGGDLVVAGADTHYFKAYAMTNIGSGQYQYVLNAAKCGAYRLTARYKVSGNPSWIYYNSFNGQRDHAIVVSPKRARDIVLYELNTINVESQGISPNDRSTFVDLWDGPGARSFNATNAKFNLNYVTNLGVNWLWFQPIHPNGIDGRLTDPDNGQPYEVGSPYAVKNFFEINPLMSKANTRASGMLEFTNFVAAADNAGVSIMLDAAFNHTAHDCELGASGVFYWGGVGNPNNWQPTDEIRNRESRVFSRTDAYDMRASGPGNIAPAPDRYDFGFKWNDVKDVYFGRYAALWVNSGSIGAHQNEGDWFDSSIGSENSSGGGNGHFDPITQNVWKYFADYALYWLDQTGHPNGTPADQSYKGIDGLRADFGQGLPPQAWEYIINKVRSRKWDFVFMSESLDGGAVTYRSNRHFDILNENILFDLKAANTATDYRTLLELRRNSYGQGLVLLNTTSHDEENYEDPFQALVRYSVGATIDGAPMVFYGQELGIARTFGFDRYQINIGKTITHFMKFNSLQPILWPGNRNFGLDQIQPVYAGINAARQASRGLRSSNRYFLNQTGGAVHPSLFAVAKYETANGVPNFSDVVFAFANLDRNNDQSNTFNVNITQGPGNLFGIKPARFYNVKNLAAYTGADPNRRDIWLWPGGGSWGSNILANGIFVGANKVPTSDAAWTNAPFEAQYLKLSDVTPPPAPAAPIAAAYVVGTSVTFRWNAVSDSEGGISGYHLVIGTTPGGADVFNAAITTTNQTVSGNFGQTLYARVAALNHAGIAGAFSAETNGTILLDPAGDNDGDGMNNASESVAGTNPLDANSVLRILNFTNGNALTWLSVAGRTYQVQATSDLLTNFVPISGVLTGQAPTTMYLDLSVTNAARFYRVRIWP